MDARIDYYAASPESMRALIGLELAVQRAGLDPALLQLVKLRASQINGCAFCLDMESAEARRGGETPRRLSALPVWRDSPLFGPAERAALAWTEALTRIAPRAEVDAARAAMAAHYDEARIADWTLAVAAINCWNRMGVGFRKSPLK